MLKKDRVEVEEITKDALPIQIVDTSLHLKSKEHRKEDRNP